MRGLGYSETARRTPLGVRFGLLLLTVLMVMVQVGWNMVSALQGPAHYHVVAMAQARYQPPHQHAQPEHHHHEHDDGVVEVVGHEHPPEGFGEGTAKRVGVAPGDAMPSCSPVIALRPARFDCRRWNARKPPMPFIAPLERPPDLPAA